MRVLVEAPEREIKLMKSVLGKKIQRGVVKITSAVTPDTKPDVDDECKDDEKATSANDTKETGIADDKSCNPPDTKAVSPPRRNADKDK